MTYDELRDYIDKFDCAGMVNEPAVKALRAVVELHKPKQSLFDDLECAECTSDEEITLSISYPCSTIQAIKKELK